MYEFLKEEDKELEFNMESKSYYPKFLMESMKLTYDFKVSTKYGNDNIGVLLSNGYKEHGETLDESSFLLSPEDALKLSDYLKACALHAMKLEKFNDDIIIKRNKLSFMINCKMLSKISVMLKYRNNVFYKDTGSIKENLESNFYNYNVIVIPYTKDQEGKENPSTDDSFSIELNLYQILYSYASNMIKSGTIESMELVSKDKKGKSHTLPYFNVFKTYIIMQIIQTEYINMDLYPNRALDKLFFFDEEDKLKETINSDLKGIMEIVKEDLERAINSKPDLMIPIKMKPSTEV